LRIFILSINNLNEQVSSYIDSDGYIGALSVQLEEHTLESDFRTAETDCCIVSTPVSDDDANAVINEITILVLQIQDILTTIISQKSIFDSVALVASFVTTDLENLQTETHADMGYLLAAVPSDLADTAYEVNSS
jgi:hypothetical protein